MFQRSGSQEGAKRGYNPSRPGRNSHHPLLAFLAEAPLVLHAWLRCGNTGSARGAAAFLTEAFALMPAHWKLRTVRADSGFFENALLTFLEARGIPYIVVARLTQTAMRVIRRVSGAHGFNIGMNQGQVSGAGIAAHLHQHVVPRWTGDANFITVVGGAKILPQLLADTRTATIERSLPSDRLTLSIGCAVLSPQARMMPPMARVVSSTTTSTTWARATS